MFLWNTPDKSKLLCFSTLWWIQPEEERIKDQSIDTTDRYLEYTKEREKSNVGNETDQNSEKQDVSINANDDKML